MPDGFKIAVGLSGGEAEEVGSPHSLPNAILGGPKEDCSRHQQSQGCGEQLELSDGKILTTMEWLMVFAKVPLYSMVFQWFSNM